MARTRVLLVQVGDQCAGIPIASVREIMRPLPISPISGVPDFVLGVSIIRGASLPVVDLGAMLGLPASAHTFRRFAALDVQGRAVAVAVDLVHGIVELDPRSFLELPPLLSHAASDAVETLALHDAALLLVLRAARLVVPPHETHPEVAS